MDIRGAVDAAVPTNIIAAKAAEVRANLVNWQSYLQSQMISVEDCEFIKKFEVANSEEKQLILTNEGHQCAKTFLNLMAHISKEQTVQYILTLIDDTLINTLTHTVPLAMGELQRFICSCLVMGHTCI
uniref:V-type proton ATPase subunit H n=1 Tax=Echeneis naucrates TaxID=173247 RepID=A0A665WPT8_ECHNA